MTVAVTHLSKVMDIFSDILTKSRFEQRPNAGNFIPRPKAKENTTVIITKESPIQGPGTPPKRSRSSKEVTGRGKKAGREFISDGANPDDATFVEGLEKAKRHKLMDMINTRMKEKPATQKKAEKSQQGDYSPTLKRNFTPEEQKRVDFVRQVRAGRGKSDSSTPPKRPRSARAMEEDRFDAHKRKMGIPSDVYIKPGERHGFGDYDSYATQEGGRLEHMEKANILKAFGVMKAPTSGENADKLNRELKQEQRERKELQRLDTKLLRDTGVPKDQIPKDSVKFASRVKAPSNLYTSEESYRSAPDLESLSGGSELERQKLLDSAKKAGKARATADMKAKYGDWDSPHEQSAIQNLKKAEEDKSVAPIRSVAPNRRRKEAETLKAGRRELREATKGLPPLKAAQVRREAAQNYRRQRFGGRPGHTPRHGRLKIGDGHVESTETKTVRPGAKRVSDKVSAQGPERQQVNTGMGKRGSDVPTRSVEESTARMVRSGQALSRGARRDIASGQSIAAKDPKTVTVKPDDYKIKLYKALGVSNKKKSDGGEKYASGARGRTPALLGMRKASKKIKDMTGEERVKAYNEGKLRLNRSYRPGQGPHPDFAQKPTQRELPFSTEDRDHIAPTPEPHGDNLPEPTRRGGSKQGSRRKGDIPKEGWKEAALLWGKQSNGKGHKVKSRIGDHPDGYPI